MYANNDNVFQVYQSKLANQRKSKFPWDQFSEI